MPNLVALRVELRVVFDAMPLPVVVDFAPFNSVEHDEHTSKSTKNEASVLNVLLPLRRNPMGRDDGAPNVFIPLRRNLMGRDGFDPPLCFPWICVLHERFLRIICARVNLFLR